MTLQNLFKSLLRRGYSARLVKMSFGDTAIMIDHDYSGLYPDENALKIAENVARLARKNGFFVEPRGYWSASLVRDMKAIEAENEKMLEIDKFWEARHEA